jgi:hypothetical protein
MAGFKKDWSRDWFRRKEEDAYTYYDPSKKLFDWETGRDSYSSYFVRDNESLKSAAKMVSSMFRVMDVPKDMKMESQVKAKKRDDKVTIPVPLAMLRDDKGVYKNKDTELLDAFYGASIQNAALATMQSKSEYSRTMTARSKDTPTTPVDLLYSLLNTERIDKKVAERYPGYSKFIQKFKQYQYDKIYQPIDSEEHAGKRLLELISKFLRYPATVTEEEMTEFAEPVTQIEHYIKKHGFPKTSMDCERQAAYMYNVVEKYMEEEEKNPEGSGKKPSPEEMAGFAESLMKSMVNAEDEEESEEFQKDFNDFADDMEDKEKENRKMDYDWKSSGIKEDAKNIKFLPATSNADSYKKALKEIDTCKASVLANLFSRKCKDYQFSMKSMRSGRLDTNKIAEAKQRVSTVYERYGEVKTNKLNIGLLVDESGSMGGDKIAKARQASIFLNEVFKKVSDVRLYIYGHTADSGGGITYGDVGIRVYKEHGKATDAYTLGSISARHNNRDGDAILACAKRIRRTNSDPCLLFVISDGAPHAHDYSGKSAVEDTRKKVLMAQALGFQVIQIAIEEYVPSEEMFDYSIKMTDIKSLPNDLIAYVSSRVDKLIVSRVTM